MPSDFARSEREESMKNIRSELQLFATGADGCAAEQSKATAVGENDSEPSEDPASAVQITESAKGDTDAINRICTLLGMKEADAKGLLEGLIRKSARASLEEKLKARRAKKSYSSLLSEAEKLSSSIKGFDIGRELSDRRFGAMIKAGLTVEEAYRALHTEELIETAAKNARLEAFSRAREFLESSSARPAENGADGKAPVKSQRSVESLSGRGIRDILRRVENGAKIKF